jgi:exosortase
VRHWCGLAGKPAVVLTGLTVASLFWAYWPTLGDLVDRWERDPHYSHGYLVPGFALLLLWLRREQFRAAAWRPSPWGIVLLLAAAGLRLAGTYYYFPWFDSVSLLPCLAGLCLLLGGWPALRVAWPALVFLVFMLPLPHRVETALAGPLRRVATVASTYVLQTFGLPALDEGNTILLNDVKIGIVEACSGLSMLVVFFALSTAIALLIRRPLWEKLLLLLSAVPVALLANIARITVTALLHELVGSAEADAFFHDGAGWFMMPLAVLLLWAELGLLSWLLEQPAGESPVALGWSRPAGAAPPRPPAPRQRSRRGAPLAPRT